MAKQIKINFSEKEFKILKESLKSYKDNLALELYDNEYEMTEKEVNSMKTFINGLGKLIDTVAAQEAYEKDEDKYWD